MTEAELIRRCVAEGLYATQIQRITGVDRRGVVAFARLCGLPLARGERELGAEVQSRRACVAEVAALSAEDAKDWLLDLLLREAGTPQAPLSIEVNGARLAGSRYRLLRALWDARPRVVVHEALLGAVAGPKPPADWPEMGVIPVYVCGVRKWLRDARLPARIRNEHGVGYRLDAPPDLTLFEDAHA